jgi:hypothetical protein
MPFVSSHWRVLKNGDPHYLLLHATSMTKFCDLALYEYNYVPFWLVSKDMFAMFTVLYVFVCLIAMVFALDNLENKPYFLLSLQNSLLSRRVECKYIILNLTTMTQWNVIIWRTKNSLTSCLCSVCLMEINATSFNTISFISWWWVLLVEKTGGPGEN